MVSKKRSIGALLTVSLTLVGCETTNSPTNFDIKSPLTSLKSKKQAHPAVLHAFQLLREEKYKEASQFLNQALQAQPRSVIFHILNALTYEKLAEKGDASALELAIIGYQNALNLDSSNVFAVTQLGKIEYNSKNYTGAQEHFANALLLKPNDPCLLHEFAAASYYAYDLKAALFAIKKAEKLKPDDPLIHRSAAMIYAALGEFETAKKHFLVFQEKVGNDPEVDHVASRFNDWSTLYKSGRITLTAAPAPTPTPSTTSPSPTPSTSSTSSSAAPAKGGSATPPPPPPSTSGSSGGGGGDSSGGGGDASGDDAGGSNQPSKVSEAKDVLALPFPGGGGNAGGAEPASSVSGAPSNPYGPQIVVDCYLLRITEDTVTSKGNNILDNLAITLNPGGWTTFKGSMWGSGAPINTGSLTATDSVENTSDAAFNSLQAPPVTGAAASVYTPNTTVTTLANVGSLSGRIFTGGITWAGLTYSLNIANATDNRTEVVSRPSIMTFLNQPGVFFSGDELVNGFTGQFGGTLVTYPVGVTLQITPVALDGDILTLNVGIEGSLLKSPAPNLAQTVDVAKTRIDTYAKIRLGETLMLGGLYERAEISSANGFPGLQDIPIIQYFFSNETTASSRKSIVFMLTPRSPDAVKSAVSRAMAREAVQPHYEELVNRNPDWFSPETNATNMFRYLSLNPVVYYEFRTGDILPPSWGWEPSMSDKLAQLTSFLYY